MSHDQQPLPTRAVSAAFRDSQPGDQADPAAVSTRHLTPNGPGHPHSVEPVAEILAVLQRLAIGVETLNGEVRRVADHLSPEPGDVVGTDYIAQRLACTQVWVTDMARNGQIPKNCIVPGTGNGKPWKFYRRGIDGWLATR